MGKCPVCCDMLENPDLGKFLKLKSELNYIQNHNRRAIETGYDREFDGLCVQWVKTKKCRNIIDGKLPNLP